MAFAAGILLFCHGAAAADVRGSMPLPVSAQTLAAAFGLASPDASTLLLSVVRLLYESDGRSPKGRRVRDVLVNVLSAPRQARLMFCRFHWILRSAGRYSADANKPEINAGWSPRS